MGVMKSQRPETNKRKLRRSSNGREGIADWASADAELLRRAIETVARTGGALRFGYTRDGGAYSIGVYGDGDPYTEYIRPSEDLNAFLSDICESFA